MGRVYYAMFYTAEALLNEKGLTFKKHTAVHSEFAKQFVVTGQLDAKYHRWILTAFDARLTGDYGAEVEITSENVEDMIEQAQEFLDVVKRHLESQTTA